MNATGLERNHGYFEGVGRVRLHYRSWEVQSPRAALLVVHGLFEHSARYKDFAEDMAEFRFSSFVLDLRGHGLSDGRRGHVSRFDFFVQDVLRFRRLVAGIVDVGVPLFLVGHSMGGLIALRCVQENDSGLKGAIVISPWLGVLPSVPEWRKGLARVLSHVLPALPFPSGLDSAQLSHDPTVVAAYRDDPLVHDTITPRLFTEASAAMRRVFERASRIRLPLLLLIAGEDGIVDAARTQELGRIIHSEHVTVRTYADHFHELLNEPTRGSILTELRDWLSRQV